MSLLNDCYIGYVNLSYRTDRKESIERELCKVGIAAERFDAILTTDDSWNKPPYQTMFNRTRGAIGCYLSQMEVLKIGLSKGRTTMVLEDDAIFCSDFKERMNYVEKFLESKEWDIIWLGATFHADKAWWYNDSNTDMIPPTSSYFNSSSMGITKDFENTEDERIKRTFGCFCTYGYIVNINSIQKVLDKLNLYMPISMGIDWSMIIMQPSLKTYSFVPGMIKQMDNKSDIGFGDTIFSGFAALGPYWWQDKIEDFLPSTYNWNQ